MTAINYRPEIDGLRAYAVIPVILFHCDERLLPGGFLGVDVFFVISGFLITSIILRELDSGKFSLRRFWTRRIRRILPNLILVSLVTLAATWAFVFKGDHAQIGRQITAALFSVANIYFWRAAGDYWGQEATWAPFLHTWSLSVEEQFYLFLPLVIQAVHRISRTWIPSVMLATFALSLAAYVYGMQHHPVASFYLLPTRAWEMAAGGLLAWAFGASSRQGSSSWMSVICTVAGLGAIAAAYAGIPGGIGSGVATVLGACLTITAGGSRAANLLLGNPVAVAIGKLSYGLYLWHWPVLVIGRDLGWGTNVSVLIATTFVLAMIGYFLVENPVRSMSKAVPGILAAFALTAALAIFMASVPAFYDTKPLGTPTFYGMYYDTSPRVAPPDKMPETLRGLATPRRPAGAVEFDSQGILAGDLNATPSVVVLGDSQGTMWSHAVDDIINGRNLAGSLWSMNAMPPYITIPIRRDSGNRVLSAEECERYDRARIRMIEQWQPAVVIVAALWAEAKDHEADDLVDFLSANAGQVLLVEQPPEAGRRGRGMLQYLCYLGLQRKAAERADATVPAGNVANYARGRQLVRQLAERHSNCVLLPTADVFERGTDVLVMKDGAPLYIDATHLSEAGVALCKQRLADAIDRALSDHKKGGR